MLTLKLGLGDARPQHLVLDERADTFMFGVRGCRCGHIHVACPQLRGHCVWTCVRAVGTGTWIGGGGATQVDGSGATRADGGGGMWASHCGTVHPGNCCAASVNRINKS